MNDFKVYCFADRDTFGDKLDFLGSNIIYLKDVNETGGGRRQ